MLDVAQNTARLNSLISRYYTAEFELESKTESKLALGQQSAQNTIDKNKGSLALMDKYDALEKSLSDGQKTVEIEGIKCDLSGQNNVEKFMQDWHEANPAPAKGKGDFAYATKQTPGFDDATIKQDAKLINEAMTNVSLNHSKPTEADYGAEPNQSSYTKTVKDDDGNETTVPDEDAYNKAHKEWEEKKQKAEEEYQNKCAGEWLEAEKNKLVSKYFEAKKETYDQDMDDKYAEAAKKYQSDETSARTQYNAAYDYAQGQQDSLSKAKAKESERAQLEFDIELKEISMKESMLDQEIQALQAEVTAIKTEIDSLKQERNSNVQSDFKLFG